jgi:hypothetical protein
MREDWLYEMTGIKWMILIAGALGGVIQLALNPGLTVMGAVVSVLAGVCCAAFLTPSIHLLYELPLQLENGVAFLFGLCGMTITGKVYMFFKNFELKKLLDKLLSK